MSENFEVEVSSILGVLDTHLRQKSIENPPRGYEKYHPSAFGECLRKMQYYRYCDRGYINLISEPLDSKSIRLFDKGHNMHSRWARYSEEMGILRGYWECLNPCCGMWDDNGKFIKIDGFTKPRFYGEDNSVGCFKPEKCICGSNEFKYHEITVKDTEMNFYGHCDMVWDFSKLNVEKFKDIKKTFCVDKLPKNPIVIDMKTCNDNGFKKAQKEGPKLGYRIQLTIYANILPVDFGLLIYENKNDSNITAFRIDKNTDTVFATIKNQAKLMNEMVDSKALPPPRPDSKDTYECSNCPFAKICHKSSIWSDKTFAEKRKNFYKNLL